MSLTPSERSAQSVSDEAIAAWNRRVAISDETPCIKCGKPSGCDIAMQLCGDCHVAWMTGMWTEQDRAHLKHLAEADEPTWMGEVASRALKYIEHLYVENQSLRDSARQHDMREELAHALGVEPSEAPDSLLSRVHELAESIRADAAMYEAFEQAENALARIRVAVCPQVGDTDAVRGVHDLIQETVTLREVLATARRAMRETDRNESIDFEYTLRQSYATPPSVGASNV